MDGKAIYFSRSPIPYVRRLQIGEWMTAARFWSHIGIYGYTKSALMAFSSFSPSHNEVAESLEQLRFVDNGWSICTIETASHTMGIDTMEDLMKARSWLGINK